MKNAHSMAQAVSCRALIPEARAHINYSKNNIIPTHTMKACRRSSGKLHSFLTSALDSGGWSTSRHGPSSHREESGVGPRPSPDDLETRKIYWPYQDKRCLSSPKKLQSVSEAHPAWYSEIWLRSFVHSSTHVWCLSSSQRYEYSCFFYCDVTFSGREELAFFKHLMSPTARFVPQKNNFSDSYYSFR